MDSWVRKIPCRRDRLPTPVLLGFPGGSAGKESICDAGDLGLIPGLGRSPGEGSSYPLQDSCLENPMDRGILEGCISWGHKESDTTEELSTAPELAKGDKNAGICVCRCLCNDGAKFTIQVSPSLPLLWVPDKMGTSDPRRDPVTQVHTHKAFLLWRTMARVRQVSSLRSW